jgi:ABC-type spermidine/putrescine transport system permease subunit I
MPRESIKRYSLFQSMLLISPLMTLLAVFYVYPLVSLFPTSLFSDQGFTLQHYERFFSVPLYSRILLRTIRISLFVTVLCLVIGYPVAYFLAELKSPTTSALLLACVLLPFWTSILVRTYSWVVLFQTQGLINNLLLFLGVIRQPLSLLNREFSVYVGMVHVLLPFLVLPVYSVLKNLDRNLIRAGRNLGANPFRVFARIVFPLSLPGVGAGVMFVFILSLGFYITPAILGGPRTMMISTLIDQQVNKLMNWEFAAAISAVLLVTTIGMIVGFNKVVGLDKIYSE